MTETPDTVEDAPEAPSLLARLRAAFATLLNSTTKITGGLALALLLVVSGWMVVDQVRFWMRDDHTGVTAQRDFLCNTHAFELSSAELEGLSDMQKIVQEIYILKETARQHAVPFDPIGRIQHFIRCVVISDVSMTNVSFEMVQDQRVPYTQDIEALLLWENDSLAFVNDSFADMVPSAVRETWGQRILALTEALQDTTAPAMAVIAGPSQPVAAARTLDLVAPVAADLQRASVLIAGSSPTAQAAMNELRTVRDAVTRHYETTLAEAGGPVSVSFGPEDPAQRVVLFQTADRTRTIAAFDTRAEADIALRALKAAGAIRLDAYTRVVATWCSDAVRRVEDGPEGVPTFACRP